MKAAIARVLDDCAGLRAGEQVAIVSDTGFDPALVEAFAREVRARDAVVVSLLMEPPRLPGEEPPPIVAAAMRSANLVLELTSTFIGSSQARVLACQAGARYLALPAYNKEILRDGGPLSVDFAGIRPTVLRLAERWGAASEYRLTTPAGTDLRGSIRGRKGRALHGIAREPGSYMVPPDIEAGTAPVEGTSEGEAVIDGALLFMYDKIGRAHV